MPVGLELGGKDAAYVRSDSELETAIPTLVEGALYNGGQSCCAVERIYVDKKIYHYFVESYSKEVEKWSQGDPSLSTTNLGPQAREGAPSMLRSQVEDAISKGAKAAFLGNSKFQTGYFGQVSVLFEVNHKMSIMKDESFGPIIGIMSVDNETEALELVNDSTMGLTSSVWTKDREFAINYLSKVKAGTVYQNRCDFVDPYLPWNGWNDSGQGATLSHIGFDYLTRPKGFHLR